MVGSDGTITHFRATKECEERIETRKRKIAQDIDQRICAYRCQSMDTRSDDGNPNSFHNSSRCSKAGSINRRLNKMGTKSLVNVLLIL